MYVCMCVSIEDYLGYKNIMPAYKYFLSLPAWVTRVVKLKQVNYLTQHPVFQTDHYS